MIIALIALFFAGAFLCNSIPHFVSGLMGRPFPSPFSKPAGVGDSSPVVNVLWGFLNLVIGLLLLLRWPIAVNFYPNLIAFLVGVLVMALQLSSHFGKVQAGKSSKS
jgi:hypothetical protein